MEIANLNMALVCVPSTSVTKFLKCATYLSRTFIKYSEYYNTFWQFLWKKTYFLQALEEDKSSGENAEKIINQKMATLFFVTGEANDIEGNRKNQKGNKSRRAENSKV
jgi:hypothetical protein